MSEILVAAFFVLLDTMSRSGKERYIDGISHSSTPLLHLCPPDKCFRCCLASLQSGLNWN